MFEVQLFLWLIKVSAWCGFFFFSLRNRLVVRYPLVHIYVVLAIFGDVSVSSVAFWHGTSTMLYSYAYIAQSIVTAALASLVLAEIYLLLGGVTRVSYLHVMVVLTLLVIAIAVNDRNLWIYIRLLNGCYIGLAYLGLVTVIRMQSRRHEVLLGWNLKMVLFALTLPAAFFSLVFVIYTFGSGLSQHAATLWLTGVGVASWVILAVGMSEYSPPVFLNAREGEEGGSDDPNEDDDQSTQRMEANRTCSI